MLCIISEEIERKTAVLDMSEKLYIEIFSRLSSNGKIYREFRQIAFPSSSLYPSALQYLCDQWSRGWDFYNICFDRSRTCHERGHSTGTTESSADTSYFGPSGVRALPWSRTNIVAFIIGVIFSSFFLLYLKEGG